LVECPSCGGEVAADAKFCPTCGAGISTAGVAGEPLKYEIKYRPSYSLLEIRISPGGFVTAEAGAMTYMSSNIEVETRTRIKESGIWGAIKVSLLGGETLFITDYIARGGEGKVGFVSAPLGDITRLEVGPEKGYIVQSSAYIASTPGVKLDTKWQGFTKGLFGQNLFMIKTSGRGDIFVNTFGAIDKHELKDGETLIVDNFHLAALSTTCKYEVRMFGGLKSTLLGGEGLVTDVTGPGEVYIQTKNPQEFVNWLWRYLGPRVHSASRLNSAGLGFGRRR